MQLPRKRVPHPGETPPLGRIAPSPAPPRETPRGGRGWWVAGAVMLLSGAVAFWMLRPGTAKLEAGAGTATVIRTAVVGTGTLERTLTLSGTTAAENYVTITSPRLRGSRSRRGATLTGATIGIASNLTVSSTSSVAPTATMSSLSQTGVIASSNSAASGGGFEGGGQGTSSRFRAATSRLSTSRSSSSSKSNISTPVKAAATAMGTSGLGTTSASLPGGSSGPPGGSSRRRGDFHLVLQKLAPPGSKVIKGDVIAEFDRQYMLTRLDDYQASVAQHEANIKKNKADIEVSRKAFEESVKVAQGDLEKAQLDVRATPVLSAIQGESLKLSLEEAQAAHRARLAETKYIKASEEADLRYAGLDLREAKVELRRARTNVDKLLVKAPISGMTIMMNTFRNGELGQVREGDVLWRGQSFMQVVDIRSMVVNAKVNQVDVQKLRIGMKARARFDAFPELKLPARIYSIGTVAKAARFRREYVTEVPVTLKLERTDPRIIPDLSVRVEVILERQPEATVAPLGAVFRDADGNPRVYVREPSGWRIRPVKLGMHNYLAVAVRSGLRPGEEVALDLPSGSAVKD